jgi:hypothetical protein
MDTELIYNYIIGAPVFAALYAASILLIIWLMSFFIRNIISAYKNGKILHFGEHSDNLEFNQQKEPFSFWIELIVQIYGLIALSYILSLAFRLLLKP